MGEMVDFLFGELAEGQPVEVLRVGSFTDLNGQAVDITSDDLDAFVVNFDDGAAGQEVPIDVDHERAEAAGWIKSLSRAGDRLVMVPDWNEMGKMLVGDRVYRYVSATIDVARQVIKSVSLVNFPAVKGLQPVELSEGVYTMEISGLLERVLAAVTAAFSGGEEGDSEERERENTDTKDDELEECQDLEKENVMDEKEKAELRARIREEVEAEMAEQKVTRAELKDEARAEVEAELAAKYERRQGLVEFAAEVCGAGLSAKPDDVVDVLDALPDEHTAAVKQLLKAKVVEFGERGSTGAGNDKKKLEGPYATQLRAWKQRGQNVAEFFELNEDILGKADEYDLSEFEEEK